MKENWGLGGGRGMAGDKWGSGGGGRGGGGGGGILQIEN